ncbi:MAG: 6-phosphogluconolactonase [Bacteroides sp.]
MKLSVFPTSIATARALILRILTLMKESPNKVFNVAVSGGSTPALMFDLWANEYKRSTPWERLNLYWVDERCVKPTDSESNYGLMNSMLLYTVPIPPDNVHRIHGENDPESEAERYSNLLRSRLPLEEGWPVFDIILLGAGSDGHTSSIFPGQEDLLHASVPYVVSTAPITNQKRICMTGIQILNAHFVFFLVTGSSKTRVISEMLQSSDGGPAAYIARHAKNVELFADQVAMGNSSQS